MYLWWKTWFLNHYALPGQTEDMWTSKLLCSRNHMILCEQAKTSEWTSSPEFHFLRISRTYFNLRGEGMGVDGSTWSRNAPWLGFMRCPFLTHLMGFLGGLFLNLWADASPCFYHTVTYQGCPVGKGGGISSGKKWVSERYKYRQLMCQWKS